MPFRSALKSVSPGQLSLQFSPTPADEDALLGAYRRARLTVPLARALSTPSLRIGLECMAKAESNRKAAHG